MDRRGEKGETLVGFENQQSPPPVLSKAGGHPGRGRTRRRVWLSPAQSMTQRVSLIPISFRAAHSHVGRAGGGVDAGGEGEPPVTVH